MWVHAQQKRKNKKRVYWARKYETEEFFMLFDVLFPQKTNNWLGIETLNTKKRIKEIITTTWEIKLGINKRVGVYHAADGGESLKSDDWVGFL